MKLKANPFYQKYKPVMLYLEDVSCIFEIMSKYGEVKISNKKYTFDNWNDFIENFTNGTGLTFAISFIDDNFKMVSAEIHIYQTMTILDISGPEAEKSALIFFKIDQILSTRQRKINWYLTAYLGSICGLTLMILATLSIFSILNPKYESIETILLCWLLFAMIFIKTDSNVILKNKHEIKNFIQRHGEDSFVKISVYVIGAALFFLIQWFLSNKYGITITKK